MGVLRLTITKPANGQVFTGAAAVPLAGRLDSDHNGPLFYAWYSSLYVAPFPLIDAALHRPADPRVEVTKPLEIGSHVLTFMAKNVAGDDKASIAAVTEAGMAGGPPGTPTPCVVTVLVATLVEPKAGPPTPTVSKAAAVLAARAPTSWPLTEEVNRVGYEFTFTSAVRTVTFTPPAAALVFEGDPQPPKVRYSGSITDANLVPGTYELRARVFDLQHPAVAHESAPLTVNVTA